MVQWEISVIRILLDRKTLTYRSFFAIDFIQHHSSMGRGDNNIELGENINDYPSTYSKTFMMIKGQWSFYSTYSTYSIIMNRPAGKREKKRGIMNGQKKNIHFQV